MNRYRIFFLGLIIIFGIFLGSIVHAASKNTELGYPFAKEYTVTSPFGWRKDPFSGEKRNHTGIDIGAPNATPVLAVRSGIVVHSGKWGGYGNTVILQHENPRQRSLYAHLSIINVRLNQSVQEGNVIGNVGSTGRSNGPHLHFELREPNGNNFVAVNPAKRFGSPLSPSNPAPIVETPDCNTALFGTCEPAVEQVPTISEQPDCDLVLFGDCI